MDAVLNEPEQQAPLTEVVSPTEATKPVPPPKLTAKQIGQLRRQYITVVRSTVTACGHKVKFDANRMPTTNCVDCWRAYFMTSVDLEGIHVILTKQGVRALTAQKGKKFVKNFHGFLSTCLLPSLKSEVETLVPADPAVIVGGLSDVQKDRTIEGAGVGIYDNTNISTLRPEDSTRP